MTTLLEVNRLAGVQERVLSAGSADLRRAFSQLDLSRPDRARDGLLELFPTVAARYGDASSTAAAEWYEGTRRRQVGGTFAAQLAPSISEERARATVRWAAGALFTESPLSTFGLLDGSLVRALGDASRDTITINAGQDAAAMGWARIARPIACDFCVMLAQRGAVYKRSTATFGSHDNCHCKASPSFDSNSPEVDVGAYQASERLDSVRSRANDPTLSAADRAKAQRVIDRHRKTTREWLDSQSWKLDDFRAALE